MTRRRPSVHVQGAPDSVLLLTQRVHVALAENLHHVAEPTFVHEPAPGVEPTEAHGHRAYGVYDEAAQVITLDDQLGFERARETFLHESLHGILAISQLDSLIEGQAAGFGEHLVASLSPVLLAFLRDNPKAVAWLQETQTP